MPEFGRFTRLDVENFRGFRRPMSFDVDASAVLISGPNGTGKTSFFDAFQWLLLGTLSRFDPHKARRTDDVVSNRYSESASATVTAEFIADDLRYELTRQGPKEPHKQSLTLAGPGGVVMGQEAEATMRSLLTGADDGDLASLLLASGLMQQDRGRDVLEERANERYKQLTTRLGLDSIASFAVEARDQAKTLKQRATASQEELSRAEADLLTAREKHQQLLSEQRLDAQVQAAREPIADRIRQLAPALTVDAIPNDDTQASLLQEAARALGGELNALLEQARAREVELASLTNVRPNEFERLEAAAIAATRERVNAAEALRVANNTLRSAQERSSESVELASRALRLLGPECPVCRQPIAAHEVEAHLKAVIEGDLDGQLLALVDTQSRVDAEHSVAIERERLLSAELAPLRAGFDRLQQIRHEAAEWLSHVGQMSERLKGPIAVGNANEIQTGDVAALALTVDKLRELWRSAAELKAVLQSGPSHDQIVQATLVVNRTAQTVEALTTQTTQANRQAAVAKELSDAAAKATTGVVAARFNELRPLIEDIYARLDPHPTFRNMVLEVDVYNGQSILVPVARDESAGVDADPILHFSSAQANVAALSYFLALGWAAGGRALPFLLLDDPVQSMDDINVLGFADLCRHVRREHQLFVSTHDHRLALLLERKLAPRRHGETAVSLEFDGWTADGPRVGQRRVAAQIDHGESRALVKSAA